MPSLSKLKIHLYADGANKADMLALYKNPLIKGFTTNPSLVRKAGVTDYEGFAKDILKSISDRPISFEVFADEFSEMERQAIKIKAWGPNVYVKIPVMNTKKQTTYELIATLTKAGVKLNVTALFTVNQVKEVVAALKGTPGAVVSVFAGRIADAGVNPSPIMKESLKLMAHDRKMELLWASTREIYNIFEAEECGTHIITVPHSILNKLDSVGTDLEAYSHDTVKMFYKDATEAGFKL